jgi:hypothetical protein
LTLLLAVFYRQDRKPCNGASPLVYILPGVGVRALDLKKPRALKLLAWVKPIQGAIGFGFELHTSVFCCTNHINILDRKVDCRASKGMVVGTAASGCACVKSCD